MLLYVRPFALSLQLHWTMLLLAVATQIYHFSSCEISRVLESVGQARLHVLLGSAMGAELHPTYEFTDEHNFYLQLVFWHARYKHKSQKHVCVPALYKNTSQACALLKILIIGLNNISNPQSN